VTSSAAVVQSSSASTSRTPVPETTSQALTLAFKLHNRFFKYPSCFNPYPPNNCSIKHHTYLRTNSGD
jgi:hypothetical protein